MNTLESLQSLVIPPEGDGGAAPDQGSFTGAASPSRHPLLANIPIVTPGEQFMRDCRIEFIRRCRSDRVTEMGPHEMRDFWERKR